MAGGETNHGGWGDQPWRVGRPTMAGWDTNHGGWDTNHGGWDTNHGGWDTNHGGLGKPTMAGWENHGKWGHQHYPKGFPSFSNSFFMPARTSV
ncbi:hypothetical protein ACFQ2C_08055 [Sphingobacterium daejeonense]|uniref:Uncharacterized protein n=1 Tax=Sphingobacterium daejeonense TaxID=371142 RepID=A0ABW3RLH3_9SPHI